MKASASDKKLDEAITKCQQELESISRNIERMMDNISDEKASCEKEIARKFEDLVTTKLNGLVNGKSCNFDAEAVSMINSTATLLMNEYKAQIQQILREHTFCQKDNDRKTGAATINLDLSDVQISELCYNLDLNTMGHEYDGWIKAGVIAAAAVGVAAAVASSGGTAAAALANPGTMLDLADTVTDVSSIASNQNTASRIERAAGFMAQATDRYHAYSESNQQIGQQFGSDKGLIDSMVGLVTDKMMSKPQRIRAVRNYINDSLIPEFKSRLQDISIRLTESIRTSLQNGVTELIEQKRASLNQLKTEQKEKKELFDERMNQLREYKTQLLTL